MECLHYDVGLVITPTVDSEGVEKALLYTEGQVRG
jgi:hypothetical protein